jgi:Fe-S cluster assembly protein SufD
MTRAVEEPSTQTARERAVAGCLADFAEFDRAAAREQPDWLVAARRDAVARFGEQGFPTTKAEAWRFTSIAPIADEAMTRAPAVAAVDVGSDVVLDGAALVVLVNGRFAPDLSSTAHLPAGVLVASLKTALQDGSTLVARHLTKVADGTQAFVALNTAFLEDGVIVAIAADTVVATPIQLLFVSTGQPGPTSVSHPRVLVVAGEHSQAQIVETYSGADGRRYFTNAVTEIVAEAGAVLDHYKMQQESPQAFHLGSMAVRAGRGSSVSSHSLALGGQLVRNDVVATMADEGAECTLNGLYLAGGTTLVDNHTTIDHAMPHCQSHELYKGILWDKARAVFNGKIIVRPDAQKTDAKQTNKALLLSDTAQINTKPELQIFADDVKCTHGAAIGQLDEDALFYLRARGIPPAEARAMLIQAFAGDIIHRVKVPALQARLERILLARLPGDAP